MLTLAASTWQRTCQWVIPWMRWTKAWLHGWGCRLLMALAHLPRALNGRAALRRPRVRRHGIHSRVSDPCRSRIHELHHLQATYSHDSRCVLQLLSCSAQLLHHPPEGCFPVIQSKPCSTPQKASCHWPHCNGAAICRLPRMLVTPVRADTGQQAADILGVGFWCCLCNTPSSKPPVCIDQGTRRTAIPTAIWHTVS